MKEGTSNGYTYQYAANDPLNTRIYTLSNGLEVYLSDYKAHPRIFTQIAVRAGSKLDPSEHTGLAHYLEHMLFKGTSDFGTLDWSKEKPLLDSIEQMFEAYSRLSDPSERKAHYAQIDQLSQQAASYSIANEYDAMLGAIGATGTNAYTSDDRTVYINDIPSNQLNRWIRIEANRFRTLVPRLFHTELEAVYEEKNRTLDNDFWAAYETIFEKLFPNHPYGTQTTIGTIEHLKNPSIRAIKNYFETYYRPNNVAICLSGDLDYDETIALIDQHFGSWAPNPELPTWTSPQVPSLTQSIETQIQGPEAEFVLIAYLSPGIGKSDYAKLFLSDRLLSNSQAGLIDLNLEQAQEVLSPSAFIYDNTDYSAHILYANPREGQSLEEVRDLLLEQIELLKAGDFEETLIEAIINDYKKELISSYESNRSRSSILVEVATNPHLNLSEQLQLIEEMKSLTKEDIIQFAQQNYLHHALLYKRKGKREIPQIEKPQITKVPLNAEKQSPFVEEILQLSPKEVEPVFLDYTKDLQLLYAKNGQLPLYYVKNEENDRFVLYYYSDLSNKHDPKTRIALRYLDYLAPEDLTPVAFKKELFGMGCEVETSTNQDRSFIKVSGLSEHATQAISLVEQLLSNPTPDPDALQKLIEGILKERQNAAQDRSTIRQALLSYSLYGPRSPFTNILSNDELHALTADELVNLIRGLSSKEHRILYYGPMSPEALSSLLDQHHQMPETLAPLQEAASFQMQEVKNPKVYWTHYPMVQAEIIFSSRGDLYQPQQSGPLTFYNEIFGSGMSSIVFKELREAQGLAYSTYSVYKEAPRRDEHDTFFAYIGTQADKQIEATSAMLQLIRDFPATAQGFELAQQAIQNRIRNQRILREEILLNYESARRKGLNYDVRKDIFEASQRLSLDDIKQFHKTQIQSRALITSLLANKEQIPLKALETYGPTQEISREELFGYEIQETSLPPH